jgi:hypothetical protein
MWLLLVMSSHHFVVHMHRVWCYFHLFHAWQVMSSGIQCSFIVRRCTQETQIGEEELQQVDHGYRPDRSAVNVFLIRPY